MTNIDMPTPAPPLGPFITAALSTLLSTVVWIVFGFFLKLTMVTALAVLIPGMTCATMLIAVSMGWIFVSIGRSKIQPRWVAGTAVLITITMLELLVLTYMTETGS
jgi:hypothetical protein